MTNEQLKTAGAMLYACEGTKARKDNRYDRLICSIELTNSDSRIIRTFSLFLERILEVDWTRLRGQVFYYPDLDESKLVTFWSKVSRIPVSQFQKSILLKSNPRFKPNPYGTFKLRYSHKKDFLKLQEIIEQKFGEIA